MLRSGLDNLSRARDAASSLVKRFVFKRPEDIIVEDIAMARGVFVVEGHLKGSEARLVRKNDKGVIRVRADLPNSGRKRFAVAHELGHWELHGDISQFHVCTGADLMNYSGSVPELEANVFAGELLMPTVLFRPMCRILEPGLDAIMDLATKFSTSLTSTAVRFTEENKENCIVVFSEHGKVTWWRAKENSPSTWIDSRQKIHENSCAWECFHDGITRTRMRRVPSEAWFQSLSYGKRMEVYEQSMKLGNYSAVLTLLWIFED